MRLFPVFMLVAVCVTPAMRADDLLASTFGKMDASAASFKGLTADVKKIAHNDFLKEDDVDSGTIVVKRSKPHELRAVVDITAPDKKQLELSGHTVQVYYPKSNTLQYGTLDKKTTALADQLLLLGFGSTSNDIQSAYNVTLGGLETVEGQKTVRILLVPKKPESLGDIVSIELWISETGLTVRQKFNQKGKDYLLATYTNMKLVNNLPDPKLNVPKNAHREPILK
jgi:hypothetical protein